MDTFLQLLAGNTLTRLIFFPTLACLPLLFIRRDGAARLYALLIGLIEAALGIWLVWANWGSPFPLVRDGAPLPWIPSWGIQYSVGMDGISMPLVLLSVILLPIVVIGSWEGIHKNWQGFALSLLLLTTGILGALLALDLFLFYIFWEVMLIPMYLIIGIWGGQRRVYAAVKFFLFTMAGSLLMLLAILWLAWTFKDLSGAWSFAFADLLRLQLPASEQAWLFGAFAVAFAIKVPMFPLHTWLPDAHVEAPTGGSVILAGILLKLGTYGFLRFALPLFPQASQRYAPLMAGLALVGILYGALVAWVQTDMKKLVAYSSIAHLGFVMLGLFAFDLMAWQGALLQMVSHGLSTGALFLLVGMIYERRHTKEFAQFGGLAKVMPWFAFFLVFSTLASVGLPGLNGFVGEFLILAGTFTSKSIALRGVAAAATFGVVLAAVYLLKMLAATIWGPIKHDENRSLKDLSWREKLLLAPLCLLMLWIGVAPEPFLAPSRPALAAVLTSYQARVAEIPVSTVALRPQAPLSDVALGVQPPGPLAAEALAVNAAYAVSTADLWSIAPEIWLAGAGALLLLLEAFLPALKRTFTPLSLVATLGAGWLAWTSVPTGPSFHGMLEANAITCALTSIVLLAASLALLASDGYLRREGLLSGEYHALLLWSSAGMTLMLRANELLTVFIALELLSICLYALAGYHRRIAVAAEAAIKYFLMGAFVSAFVLLGIALLYGETGSSRIPEIARALAEGKGSLALEALGVVLLIAGFGFKMSLVPFHAWSPDTYQGAPTPFVAFLSVAPKAASVAVLIKVVAAASASASLAPKWSTVVSLLAVVSMLGGNLLALVQRDLKRMLAYSGIAHMGYLLIPLASLNRDSWVSVLVYLFAYALMNAGAFAVATLLFDKPGEQHLISDLSGWGARFPMKSACLAICMLSLGGIPPTLGFFGKYLVFLHAVENHQVWLAAVGILASLVGVFYYLRVIYVLYMKDEVKAPAAKTGDFLGNLSAGLAALLTLVLGLWSGEVLGWVADAVARLG